MSVDAEREAGAGDSLPSSPSSILGRKALAEVAKEGAYVAPPIPHTFRESLNAWFKRTNSAAPELFLYRHSGYFQGATLFNAPNVDLYSAFTIARSKDGQSDSQQRGTGAAKASLHSVLHSRSAQGETEHATVGTELADDGKVGSIRMVDIGSHPSTGLASWLGMGSQVSRLINMLEIGTPRPREEVINDTAEEKVVLLHGYGAGTGFYFQNLQSLARHPNSRLYALDWLGMGRSSRVPFQITGKQAKTTETRVEAAESFFVQALEDWRGKMGLEKMTLVGHSLGGYLSIAYSLKYPQHVSRLVLLSPAGIPQAPEELRKPSERKEADQVAKEVQQSQKETAPRTDGQERQDERNVRAAAERTKRRGSESVQERIQSSPAAREEEEVQDAPKPPRLGRRRRELIQFLWEQNLSPFAILRGSLFFAPMLAGGYTSRRFATLPEEDLRTLHAYCYDIFTARGSSEYCLAHILAPFGYARLPMVDRVSSLPKSLPVTFIYGERGIDWMDEDGGRESVKRLAAAGNPHARCYAVPHAGHHVYLDNPRAFNTLLGKVLRGEVDEAGKGVAPSDSTH